ncbi:hypothetical protein BGZ49_001781, partial [Haplosporangium sp. Z 27]
MDFEDEEAQLAEAIRRSLEEAEFAASFSSSSSHAAPHRNPTPPQPSSTKLSRYAPILQRKEPVIDLTDDDIPIKAEIENASTHQDSKIPSTHRTNNHGLNDNYNTIENSTNDNNKELFSSYAKDIIDSLGGDISDENPEDLESFAETFNFTHRNNNNYHVQHNEDEDEDEELKRALALSLAETRDQHTPEPRTTTSKNASPMLPEVASPLLMLDREQMERERLERIRRREMSAGITESKQKRQRKSGSVPPALEYTSASASVSSAPNPASTSPVLVSASAPSVFSSAESTLNPESDNTPPPESSPGTKKRKVTPRRAKTAVPRVQSPAKPSVSGIPPALSPELMSSPSASKGYPLKVSSPLSPSRHSISRTSPSISRFPDLVSQSSGVLSIKDEYPKSPTQSRLPSIKQERATASTRSNPPFIKEESLASSHSESPFIKKESPASPYSRPTAIKEEPVTHLESTTVKQELFAESLYSPFIKQERQANTSYSGSSTIKQENTVSSSSSYSGLSSIKQERPIAASHSMSSPIKTERPTDTSGHVNADGVYMPQYINATFRNTYIKDTIPGNFDIQFQDLVVKEHITKAVMTTFMLDEDWLERYLPRNIPQCLVRNWSKEREQRAGFLTDGKVVIVHPPLTGYGTFHPKLMLLFYPTFCRVVISSANL